MNIDILFYGYEPGLGDSGGVRKVLSLADAMRSLGHSTQVFVPSFLGSSAPGIVTYPVSANARGRALLAYWRMAVRLWQDSRIRRPDVVFQRCSATILPGLEAKMLSARFFYEINGDAFGEKGWSMGVFRALGLIAADWINCRLADRVLVLTPGLAETARKRYGVSENRLRIVPSGADLDHVRVLDAAECRKKIGVAEGRPVVMFLGVLYRHQGVQTLIDAAPEILKRSGPVQFLIVGDGPERPALEAKAKAMNLTGDIRFAGYVPYREIPFYLGAADCCVAPFTADRGETSPLKLFDYMASGRAVVASDIPSIRPIVDHSGAIAAVAPDSPERLSAEIVRLLADKPRRERMGQDGRRFVEKEHNWKSLAQRILQD